jgi:hypothetical protein
VYQASEKKTTNVVETLMFVGFRGFDVITIEILVKSLLISTLHKVIYYIGTFLQGSTKPG